MTRIAILMMLILGTTAAHSQSPAQHSAGDDIFRFYFSRNYDPNLAPIWPICLAPIVVKF